MAKCTNKGFPIDKPDADDELYVGIVESLDPQSQAARSFFDKKFVTFLKRPS